MSSPSDTAPGSGEHAIDAQQREAGAGRLRDEIRLRERAESELVHQQALLAAVVQGARDAIVTVDDSLRIQLANAEAESLFRLASGGAADRLLTDFLPEDVRDRTQAWLRRYRQEAGDPEHGTELRRIRLVREDGDEFPAEVSVSYLEENDHRLHILIIRDISDAEATRQQLQAWITRLSTLIRNLNAGILVEDEHRRVVLANQAFCDMFGIPVDPDQLTGTDCSQSAEQSMHLFVDEWGFVTGIDEILLQRQPRLNEELDLKDGRTFQRDYVPIVIGEEYRGHLWQYTDVTDQILHEKQLEDTWRQLRTALQATEKAYRSKSEFLANMSHEIRTPMTAVLGYLDMLGEARYSDDRFDSLTGNIRRNANYLLSLINDILDLSKIEANRLEIRLEQVDLPALVEEVAATLRVKATEKGLDLHVAYEGRLPRYVDSDPLRLRQLLLNVAGNAVKFTDSGSVTLALQVANLDADDLQLRIDVRDTGIGIPPDKLDAVFLPFERVESVRQREGTGLGLSISRRIASLLGGRLTATSEPGVGSEFTLRLPLGSREEVILSDLSPVMQREGHELPHLSSRRLDGARILLVEDGLDNQRILRFYLERAGAAVAIAENGREAIDLLKSMQDRDSYHLILMDMLMPVMDGYTATRRLREMGIRLPIIALTAFAMLDDRSKTLEAGCNDYISKPINSEHFYEVIVRHLPRSVTRSTLEERPPAYEDASTPSSDTDESHPLSPDDEIERAAELVSSPERRNHSMLWTADPAFQDLVREYVIGLDSTIQDLRAARLARDNATAARLAHRVKGSAASYGFDALHQAASVAEQALHDAGEKDPFPEEAVDVLLKALTSVHQE